MKPEPAPSRRCGACGLGRPKKFSGASSWLTVSTTSMKTTASLTVLMTSRNDRDNSAGEGALLEMAASDGGNSGGLAAPRCVRACKKPRSEEHTSELQSRFDLVCRLLLEKK